MASLWSVLRVRSSLFLWAVPFLACFGCWSPTSDGFQGSCLEDLDCSSGLSCVYDLDTKRRYCARSCFLSSDCDVTEECRFGFRSESSKMSEEGLCIDRVRSCLDHELCNGLDDDCDGLIDGADCQTISGCLDDLVCGAFVCSATDSFPLAFCVPPIENAQADYQSCSKGTDCRNGLCETGVCAPLCRRNATGLTDACLLEYDCVSVGTAHGIAEHNMCQKACSVNADCANGQSCVWRATYQAKHHAWVCSTPAPQRLKLGEPCRENSIEGDDECESGLCYGLVCTRSCAGTGADCTDVDVNFSCQSTQLYYFPEERMADVCVLP